MDHFKENNKQKLIIVVYIHTIFKKRFARLWCYRVYVMHDWIPSSPCGWACKSYQNTCPVDKYTEQLKMSFDVGLVGDIGAWMTCRGNWKFRKNVQWFLVACLPLCVELLIHISCVYRRVECFCFVISVQDESRPNQQEPHCQQPGGGVPGVSPGETTTRWRYQGPPRQEQDHEGHGESVMLRTRSQRTW